MPILTVAERIGTEIEGKYKVEALLGQGGMGVVFAARHLWTERRVAIKLLRPELSALTSLESTRLIQEARTTTRLEHPHVVQVLDMGRTHDHVPYLVMERLEGVTLKQELEARGRLSAHEALELLLPLMGAMALAHDQGIVHRDLKPANIFLSRNAAGVCLPKLLDFGIAKLVHESGITASGAVVGTPHYLSPEQAAGADALGPASDVWAFGVIFFECLTGRLPIDARDPASVLARIVSGPPISLDAHLPALDAGFCAAIERALRRDLSARYADLRSFALALLTTARCAGIALPSAPDPLGLPAWSRWLAQESGVASNTTARTPAARPLVADGREAKAGAGSEAHGVASASGSGRTARVRSVRGALLLALAALALCGGSAWLYASRAQPVPRRVAARPAPEAPPSLPTSAPLSPAPSAGADTLAPQAPATPASPLREASPSRARRHERQRAERDAAVRTADQMVRSW